MLTRRDIIAEADLALRGPLDHRLTEASFANRVGKRWVGMNEWQYLKGRAFDFTTTPGTQVYNLPANLSEIKRVIGEPNVVYGSDIVEMVTDEKWHIAERRQYSVFYGRFLGYVRHEDIGDAVVPRLYLTPTPTTARALRVVYRAGWDPLADADSVADVPLWGEEAFRDLTRGLALALHRVGADPSVDLTAPIIARVRASDEFQNAIKQDALVQPEIDRGEGAVEQILRVSRRARRNGPRSTTQDLLADL